MATLPNDPDSNPEVELRRQYHELAELAGSLAHEIKNPLSVIHMNVDLISEELSESDACSPKST
jgi:nitrogen-specific signal transduction histidine kinase